MLEKVKSNVIVAIISSAIIGATLGIWEAISEGGLIRILGGATTAELADVRAELSTRGVVVAFDRDDLDQDTCPKGWKPFEQARGRVIVGAGDPSKAPAEFGLDENGNHLTDRSLRQHGGTETHQLSINEMPTHEHPVRDMEWGYSINGNDHPARIDVDDGPPWGGHTGRLNTEPRGENQPHNNMPPYIALYFCKKV